MREVGAFEAKTHLSSLLAAAERGETITITKRGRAVARLVPPAALDRARARAAVAEIRRLRRDIGWKGSVAEVLEMRDEGRR